LSGWFVEERAGVSAVVGDGIVTAGMVEEKVEWRACERAAGSHNAA
jgi:hypothetical protein